MSLRVRLRTGRHRAARRESYQDNWRPLNESCCCSFADSAVAGRKLVDRRRRFDGFGRRDRIGNRRRAIRASFSSFDNWTIGKLFKGKDASLPNSSPMRSSGFRS